ncbi:isopeptide-forming domain-containing fimbrial protein [Paenibacillus sp. GCM10027626]|uniref:isopeptide-forming domain-containing fimbrial protein n=1 Tax=Paenibacillus sp. GCM10027626 TaxID=3273411 RepID=UPI00363515C7
MNNTRAGTRRNILRHYLIKFSVLLLVITGVLPPVSTVQVHAAEPFTLNAIDSYGISADGKTLYQFDGNNPAAQPKATIAVKGLTMGPSDYMNGLAMPVTGDAIYGAFHGSGSYKLYKISADGTATLETTLSGTAGNAAISAEGKYYYSYGSNGKTYLAFYDTGTKEKGLSEIKGLSAAGADLGGDLVVDGEGYLWFFRGNAVLQLDPRNATIIRTLPITNSDGIAIEAGVRGISFLPNGKMFLLAGDTSPKFYILDPDTLSTTYLGAMTGPVFFDLASGATPRFAPNPAVIESNKTASLQAKADGNTDADHPEVGDTLLYTVQTRNTVAGSLVSNLVISDAIPEGLEYIPSTLKVDEIAVSDAQDGDRGHYANGQVTGQFGDVTDTSWHKITFQVRVLPGQAGKDIQNTALVKGDNIDVPNKPTTTVEVYPRGSVLESTKTSSLLTKADGNTDADHPEVGDTLLYAIQTRNTIADSLVTNLVISDMIPVGLEYVSETLNVDGTAVSDAEDGDRGHYANGQVTGQFGDVTDTSWHTVTFQVKVLPGQAGKNIQNTALVTGDNVGEPEEPTTTVEVYPRGSALESAKTSSLLAKADGNTDAKHPEVGDTLLYTIQTRNTVADSLVTNLVISDMIPTGLEYVSETLNVDGTAVSDAEDGDRGHYANGQVTGQFGDVTDTSWHTVTFQVKVLPGQAGKNIQNTALVTADNVGEPEEPTTTVEVYPRGAVLESTKVASLQTKADGNTDTEHPEVGDTLLYTIQTRNTVADSMVTNLVISDKIPAGLEYEPGTLCVDGTPVSDVEDGDSGHYAGDQVTGKFGDVTDTSWHTVTFQAKVLPGQASKDIQNTAVVTGDNVGDPDEPTTTVEIYPRNPALESKKIAELDTKATGNTNANQFEVGDTLLYTIETRNTVRDSLVTNLVISDLIRAGLAYEPGTLSIDGKAVTDAEGDDAGHYVNGEVIGEFGNISDNEWHTLTFKATIKAGQASKEIRNVAVVSGDNTGTPDEPETTVKVEPRNPVLESTKTAKLETKAGGNTDAGHPEVGDTLLYTIQTRNTISDSLVTNLVISDMIPAGLAYVPGTLSVDGKAVTDDMGDDVGHYADGQVVGQFGEVTDNEWRTVTFQAKVLPGQASKDIQNKALVKGDNVGEPDEPTTTVEIYPRYPALESTKSAKLDTKATGNTKTDEFEVGDTLLYTIQTRNTVTESLVTNLVISDVIPEGLEYVSDSLKVDGEAVTDVEDQDKGHYVSGKVVGQFGNIADNEWHTLTFKATIKAGQASKEIRNVAFVKGDNTGTPDEPETTVKVEPRNPLLESTKTAKLETKAAGNTDAGHPEVGDTLLYTIQTRNTISDSLVTNLVIFDMLPAGLVYVPGTLSVDGKSVTDDVGDDAGHYADGQVVGQFGEVTDIEWHTVTFQAKVLPGQASKDIQNKAVVKGDNIGEPDEPTTTVEIYPRNPALESQKSAKLETKANGNTDADHPEVGDTLLYTIQTRNTVTDSVVTNLVITDKIPAGLEYVSGTLRVDGIAVSDTEDGDAGHYVNGQVTGQFGSVTDTSWHTVTFQAKVLPGQANKDIENKALVKGDNVGEPDEPTTTVEIYPRGSVLESTKTSSLQAKADGNTDVDHPEVGDTLLYTIQTRNTIADSLVTNLVITDKIPAGLAYVPGTLSVDGTAVSDAEDGDRGHYADGQVTGQFGDVTDTSWHTVTFQAKVLPGQASKDIQNKALVKADNVGEPDEPTTTVEIYPRYPALDSQKSAKLETKADGNTDADHPEVGDTLLYTIETRNTVTDSVVTNLVITDKIPAGLEYVPGTLSVDGKVVTDAEGDDAGHYADGEVTGKIGNVTDTSWHTVTFQVKVLPGQAGKDIRNEALVEGGNIGEPDKPTTTVEIYPRGPVLESEKSAKLETKADGNKDADHPEVGDTLLYTIQTHNTNADSLATNLVISDVIPAGLAYVPGTLSVDGKAVTDAEGDDAGHYVDGQVTGQFGNVTDTSWHTVTFQAKVLPGQASKDIQNKAVVKGDNVGEPDEPTTTVEIYPRYPALESEKSAANLTENKQTYEVGDMVIYTIRGRNTVSDSVLTDLKISDILPAGLEYVAGSMKVDGVAVTDAEGDDSGSYKDGVMTAIVGDVADTNWHTLEFRTKVKAGQAGQTIKNVAEVTGGNIGEPGKPTKEIFVDNEPIIYPPYPPYQSPVMESHKTSKDLNGGNVEEGDTIEYAIQTRNTVSGSTVSNLVISDELPEGLEYVPGSLKVDGKPVTDAKDDDNGEYADGKVTGKFSFITDLNWHKLEFQAKVKAGQAGQKIENIAKVSGDNLLVPDRPREAITVVPKENVPDPEAPILESQKASKKLGSGSIKAGDKLVYTVKARNTVPGTMVNNLVIADELPAGLAYVPGTLKVDGHKVTDKADGDNGYYAAGRVVGEIGDVTDTKWHTIVFQVQVEVDQAGKKIKNVGEVAGDNVRAPEEPYEEIIVGGNDNGNHQPGKPGKPGKPGQPDKPVKPGEKEPTKPTPTPEQPWVSTGGGNGTESGSKNNGQHYLPKTATNMYTYLLAGGLLLIAGMWLARRKKSDKKNAS